MKLRKVFLSQTCLVLVFPSPSDFLDEMKLARSKSQTNVKSLCVRSVSALLCYLGDLGECKAFSNKSSQAGLERWLCG